MFFFEERCAIGVSVINTLEQRAIVQTERRVHFVKCTMPRCSQSKRHNRAAGSCRKLSERIRFRVVRGVRGNLGIIGVIGIIEIG